MKLKTVEIEGKTYAEVQDDKPVYLGDDGKEIAFDAPGTRDTISRLNGEAKGHREAKEAALEKLKAFEGVDPEKAREATEKLSKIDAKALVDAGDMDAAIKAAVQPYEEKLTAAEKKAQELEGTLNKEMIGNKFGSSKFAQENLTPAGADLLRAMYGNQLKIENGSVVGYDANGQKIYSKARPGEVANFDEVLKTFTEQYPHRDHIMKGAGSNGGGSSGNAGGGTKGKQLTRSEFDALDGATKAAKMKEGYTVADA